LDGHKQNKFFSSKYVGKETFHSIFNLDLFSSLELKYAVKVKGQIRPFIESCGVIKALKK
jgi:hypothetical protein